MCFSARIRPDPRKLAKAFDAQIDLPAFRALYAERAAGERRKTPPAMDHALQAADDAEIRAAVAADLAAQTSALEREVFEQRTRLTTAERILATKPTKKAQNDRRIAGERIERALARLADLRAATPPAGAARIFPGVYAPVVVEEGGQRWVRPMRYQCRPAGKPASYDTRYPGTYNARRDNLEGFWRGQFGHTHGLIVVERFYENVERVDETGRARNVVLEFQPDPPEPMLVACLWSRWTDPAGVAPDLLSFAAITDEPPPEVAAAGHDRCIVPIAAGDVDAWLRPDPSRLPDAYALLDARPRPYYAHRLAA